MSSGLLAALPGTARGELWHPESLAPLARVEARQVLIAFGPKLAAATSETKLAKLCKRLGVALTPAGAPFRLAPFAGYRCASAEESRGKARAVEPGTWRLSIDKDADALTVAAFMPKDAGGAERRLGGLTIASDALGASLEDQPGALSLAGKIMQMLPFQGVLKPKDIAKGRLVGRSDQSAVSPPEELTLYTLQLESEHGILRAHRLGYATLSINARGRPSWTLTFTDPPPADTPVFVGVPASEDRGALALAKQIFATPIDAGIRAGVEVTTPATGFKSRAKLISALIEARSGPLRGLRAYYDGIPTVAGSYEGTAIHYQWSRALLGYDFHIHLPFAGADLDLAPAIGFYTYDAYLPLAVAGQDGEFLAVKVAHGLSLGGEIGIERRIFTHLIRGWAAITEPGYLGATVRSERAGLNATIRGPALTSRLGLSFLAFVQGEQTTISGASAGRTSGNSEQVTGITLTTSAAYAGGGVALSW